MKTYFVKCRKNTENLNSKIFKTKIGRLIMQSKCADCEIKKSRFVKDQEAKGLLSSLGLETRLSKMPLFGYIFFWGYNMNETVYQLLLVGDKLLVVHSPERKK